VTWTGNTLSWMPRSAVHYVEDETLEQEAWPQPRSRPRPVRTPPPPRRRQRRSRSDLVWVALALLGLAAAASAAIWYVSLNRTQPAAELTVPRVVGMREAAAVKLLTTDGFAVRAIERAGNAPPGVVFSQRPAARATLARGATVTIRVGNGRR
jgi:hypothetical protein